ncbi:porin, partial [Methylobacterium sp. E-045]|nr:porin [Methylobacterium sp. E-045]
MPTDATEKPGPAAFARPARRTGLPVLLGGAFLAAGVLSAEAQTASPVGELNDQTQPRTTREVASKPADPVRTGPLAPWATDMAARGLTFDVNIYDFYQANPSAGLRTG